MPAHAGEDGVLELLQARSKLCRTKLGKGTNDVGVVGLWQRVSRRSGVLRVWSCPDVQLIFLDSCRPIFVRSSEVRSHVQKRSMVKTLVPCRICRRLSLDWSNIRRLAVVVPGDDLDHWEHGRVRDDGLPSRRIQVVREVDELSRFSV